MAEALRMLCKKQTIIKLKQYYTENKNQLFCFEYQSAQLQEEIDEKVNGTFNGNIPADRMTFNVNKFFKKRGSEIENFSDNFGEVRYQLAIVIAG